MQTKRSTIPVLLLLAGAGTGLTGCTVVSQDGQRMGLRSDAYARYVESVLQQQSEISDQLIFALDDLDPDSPRYIALEDADLAVLTACQGLNELVRASRGGDLPGGFSALRQARTVPDCENAVNQASATLAE